MKPWDIVMAHDMKRPFIGYIVGGMEEDYDGDPVIFCKFWIHDAEQPFFGSSELVKIKYLEVLATAEQVAHVKTGGKD